MEQILEKVKILSDAAKYDVSCSSSGVDRKNNSKIGSAAGMGICHSWAADGRCISLLKILFTNKCEYDCQYCVNRRSADVERASLEPEELCDLTIEFYRRNYIEGLFLSSAVEISPDYTAERILKALKLLRYEKGFAGYIHAKIIPSVSPELLHQIGLVADRLSVNVELPSENSLKQLAPQKKVSGIFTPMKQITETISERQQHRALSVGMGTFSNGRTFAPPESIFLGETNKSSISDLQSYSSSVGGLRKKETFAPAGQTTQMIIGASPENDRQIVKISEQLYKDYRMKRVYFSAYIPVGNSKTTNLPNPLTPPPLLREHRLYQADWLLRFYSFTADEILDDNHPNLDLELDPKISWALRNIQRFPIEINKASLEELMRIPGLGATSAMRILRQRRVGKIQPEDLKKIGVVLKRAKFFLTCDGKYLGDIAIEPSLIRNRLLGLNLLPSGEFAKEEQLSLIY